MSAICSITYTQDVEYVFLPHRLEELQVDLRPGESLQNEDTLSKILQEEIGQSFDAATNECQKLFSTYICNSLFFHSHNVSGQLSIPTPLCAAECREVEKRCPILWKAYHESTVGKDASCDHPGMLLAPLPYCCTRDIPYPSSDKGNNVGVAVGMSVAVLLLLLLAAVVSVGVWLIVRKFHQLKRAITG